MAILTTKKRDKLKSKTFGIPGERKYPMPDKAHAENAKARAMQQVKEGKMSTREYKMIAAKANAVLKKKGVKNPTTAKQLLKKNKVRAKK